MPTVVVALIAILVVALAVIAVVVMGVHGSGRKTMPELADVMARTARQLNGEGQPPRGLLLLFHEMDDVSSNDLNPRQITGRIRSSIASARSAASAQSPTRPPAPEATPRPAKRNGHGPAAPADLVVHAAPLGAAADATQLGGPVAGPEAVDAVEDPYGLTVPAADVDPADPYGLAQASDTQDDTVVRVDLPHVPSHR